MISLYPDQAQAAKTCSRCGVCQPIHKFYIRRDNNKRRNVCSPCTKLRASQWHFGNRNQSLANKRKWHYENLERAAQTARDWKINNRARANELGRIYRARNGDYLRAWFREYLPRWRAKNPDKVSAKLAIRKALMRRIPAWAKIEEIKKIYVFARSVNLTVDHMVPLNSPLVCGLHCPDNLQLMTGPENTRKGNRRWPDMP